MVETIATSKLNKGKKDLIFLQALKSCPNEKSIIELVSKEVNNNSEVIDFIEKYFDLNQEETHITSTSTHFNINSLKDNSMLSLINLKKVNDTRYINKFFESVNVKLPHSGLFFGCFETSPNRRKAIMDKFPFFLNWFVYFFDTLFTRVFPKLKITKKLYFYLTKGRSRVISRAETYGRLYSCGFEIVDQKAIDNIQYFVVKKVKEPVYDKNPTYGPIIRLKRIGKDKKKFRVFKLRTMHPYSEYLQEYIYNQNSLQAGGKIKDDFRISPEGRFFRKFWIDEFPMLINILKGDMKLVGVRPLSSHFFSLYTKELQDLRTQFKPGFIPPFYVDLPDTMEEIMASEKKYLEAYAKEPLKTDLKYIYLSLKNVLFKGARSN